MEKYYDIPNEHSLDFMEGLEKSDENLEVSIKANEIVSIDSLSTKEDFRNKYSIEEFLSKLDNDEKEFTLKRYENALDCSTRLKVLFDQYPEDVRSKIELLIQPHFPIEFPGTCAIKKDELHNVPNRLNYASYNPFGGVVMADNALERFEKALDFNPHIVIPTMSSAILPSIIVKKFFDHFHLENDTVNSPYFIIPGQGSDSRYSVSFSGAKDIIREASKSGEVRILIVDEFVSTGKTLDKYKKSVIAEIGSYEGLESNLTIETLDLNSINLFHCGMDWLKTLEHKNGNITKAVYNNSILKSGAKPQHHLLRKSFEIWGECFAKDFELVQEFKGKFKGLDF